MNCLQCGHKTKRGPVEIAGSYRGEELTVSMDDGFSCPSCGYATIPGRLTPEYGRRLKAKYSEKVGALTPADIRSKRVSLGVSQNRFANFLDIGTATIKRYESGEVPDAVHNAHIRLRTDPVYAEIAVQNVYFDVNTLRGSFFELPKVEGAFSTVWHSLSELNAETVHFAGPTESRKARDISLGDISFLYSTANISVDNLLAGISATVALTEGCSASNKSVEELAA